MKSEPRHRAFLTGAALLATAWACLAANRPPQAQQTQPAVLIAMQDELDRSLPTLTNRTATEFGDEPLLIARDAGVPVYVASHRYDAGVLADASTETPPTVAPRFSRWRWTGIAAACALIVTGAVILVDHAVSPRPVPRR